MPGLTKEQHERMMESIRQWGESQDRIMGEQDHQKELAAVLKYECGISEKHFKKVAKAYWADTVKKDREDTEMQLDLFEAARGFDERSFVNMIKENGATLETRPLQ